MILFINLYLFDFIHIIGDFLRYSLLPWLVLLAGCASQIPDGVYQHQCPDNSCTVRLYVGRTDMPCAFGIASPVRGIGGPCQLQARGQDHYKLVFLTSSGQPLPSDELPDLHYEREGNAVLMTMKNMPETVKGGIRLHQLPGTANRSVNPPWPKLPAASAAEVDAEDTGSELTLSDAQIRQAFIGSWVVAPKDADYARGGFISVYQADGKAYGYEYQDVACKQLRATVQGNWKIQGGKLLLDVTQSSDHQRYPIGATSTDTIMQLGGNKQVLKASDGAYLYRIKSKTCVQQQ